MKNIIFYLLILALTPMQTAFAYSPSDIAIMFEPIAKYDFSSSDHPVSFTLQEKHYIKTKYRSTEIINFNSASAAIQPTSYDLLRQYGSAMENGVSDSVILIEGHTDGIGSEQDNYNLSYKRVLAIKKFLTSFYNISPDRILVKAYGEKKPIATNMNAKGRSINRRVEFIRMQETAVKK